MKIKNKKSFCTIKDEILKKNLARDFHLLLFQHTNHQRRYLLVPFLYDVIYMENYIN